MGSGSGGLMVRIHPENREQLFREAHVQPMEMGARTMKGFVRVAPEAYRTEASLRKWIMRGVEAATAKGKKRKRSV
jgi:hypothetical protein